MYIHELPDWPHFFWNKAHLLEPLAALRHKQGRLLGQMEALGFSLRAEANLETLTLDVLKSSEIEGAILSPEQVRSSVARHLGMDISGLVPSDRNVDGVVEMMLDATRNHKAPLTEDRLCGWQAALFPGGYSGFKRITVGAWRTAASDPMQVVSGPFGRERIHFEAPEGTRLKKEMAAFLDWFNSSIEMDPVLKSGIAHMWFVTIHPFEDGNGRIARAIADMQLARADRSEQRFYSLSAQIREERDVYYDTLERTQRGDLDSTAWLLWFLGCLDRALDKVDTTLKKTLMKTRFWELHALTDLNSRQRQLLNRLLDGFEGKLTSSKWASLAKCSPDTALRDIQDLMEKSILEKEQAGGRSTSYILK
jgi:Fic family protein